MDLLKERFFNKIGKDFELMAGIVIRQLTYINELLEGKTGAEITATISENELLLDSLDTKMRDEVIQTIVLYAPRAGELRKIMAYYDMTAYLERIGDLSLNISGFIGEMDPSGTVFPAFREVLSKLLAIVKNMVQNAIFAFTCEDNRLAQETIALDNLVDSLHRSVTAQLKESDPTKIGRQQLVDMLSVNSISYNIERIGDNATNIAEAAIYLIEGTDVKHSHSGQEESLHAGSEG